MLVTNTFEATSAYALAPMVIFGGVPRSSKWPKVRALYLSNNRKCRACGGEENLNVHHIKPYHIFPQLELDESNFITLCEKPGHDCHFVFGHFFDWNQFNPQVVDMVTKFYELIDKKIWINAY